MSHLRLQFPGGGVEGRGHLKTLGLGFLLTVMSTVGPQAIPPGAAVPLQVPAEEFQLDDQWAQLPTGEEFGTISGVAVDPKGHVFALRRNDGHILNFDPSGTFLGKWPTGATIAHTIRVDREGFLWLTDLGGDEVKKFRTDGTLVMTIGTPGKPFNGPDIFHGPADVLVASNGDLYVADGYWNSRIVKFSRDGKFLKTLGAGAGRGPGQLGLPHALGQDSQGRILVSDRCDRPKGPDDERRVNPGCTDIRVQFFDADGTVLDQPLDVQPTGTAMAVIGNLIYATTGASSGKGSEVVILNTRTGKKVDAFPIIGAVHSLAVDASGENVYLADMGRFDPGKRFGSGGSVRRYTRKAGL